MKNDNIVAFTSFVILFRQFYAVSKRTIILLRLPEKYNILAAITLCHYFIMLTTIVKEVSVFSFCGYITTSFSTSTCLGRMQ